MLCHVQCPVGKYIAALCNGFRHHIGPYILSQILLSSRTLDLVHPAYDSLPESDGFILSEYQRDIGLVGSGHAVCIHLNSGSSHYALEKISFHVYGGKVLYGNGIVNAVKSVSFNNYQISVQGDPGFSPSEELKQQHCRRNANHCHQAPYTAFCQRLSDTGVFHILYQLNYGVYLIEKGYGYNCPELPQTLKYRRKMATQPDRLRIVFHRAFIYHYCFRLSSAAI